MDLDTWRPTVRGVVARNTVVVVALAVLMAGAGLGWTYSNASAAESTIHVLTFNVTAEQPFMDHSGLYEAGS